MSMAVAASHIGLATKEVNLLKSLLGMLKGTHRLPIEVEFVDFNQYVQQRKIPDILFINRDHPKAMDLWNDIVTNFPTTTAIFVSCYQYDHLDMVDQYVLKSPISLAHVIQILSEICNLNLRSKPVIVPRLNVLVVDDSFPVRKYMEHILPRLVKEDLNIEYAMDGQEAMAMASHNVYDLIFLDVVMPGFDGYKVCKFIKKTQNPYIVMLTGRKSPFDKVRGTMSGCDTYMVKPPKEKVLQKIVESCLLENTISNTHVGDELSYRY